MRKSLLIMKYMLAAVPLAMALVCSAKADTTDQVTFTVNVTSGPQSGDIFTGSFTYDATTLAMTGSATVLSFTFTDPAWAGQTLSSTGLVDHGVDNARLPALPAELTGFFFAPAEVGAPDNVFSISGTGFIYGSATIVGIDFTHDGIRYPRARHGR